MGMVLGFRRVTLDEGRALVAEPAQFESLLEDEGRDDDSFDLDKSWHGLHFLLTGTAWDGGFPEGFVLHGGTPIPFDEDMSPRLFEPADVGAIQGVLEGVTDDELRSRYDPDRMMREGIYPQIWERPPAEDDALGYVLDHCRDLRAFVAEAVRRELALIVYMT